MFGFCSCTNIKRVPGYKETDADVQFVDNYQDNRVSIPALIVTVYINSCIFNIVKAHYTGTLVYNLVYLVTKNNYYVYTYKLHVE